MKSFIKYFSSVKLAITLFIIITLASILGTLIPQQRSAAEYAEHYGRLSDIIIRLEFTNLYHSWWFITLLFLFSLNISICTLKRLSPKLKKTFRPRIGKEKKSISALSVNENLRRKGNLINTKEEVIRALLAKRYRVKEVASENRAFLLARKKVVGIFGSDFVHLGVLIILLGGIISGIGGSRDNLSLSEGQIMPIPGADFKLKLDKFETDYYANGSVKDWKSTLTVIENDKQLLSKTIEVNHPLSYKGFVFYQSSHGWNWENPSLEIWAKRNTDPSFLKKMELKVGERAKLDYENFEISVLHFIPDFVINDRNEITTRSLEPNNPAVFIEGWQEEEKIFSGWIFAKFPDFARIHSSEETDIAFEFKDFKADQYSGIQMARDPGVNFIWVGCAVLMVGLLMAFYWPIREIGVILEETQGKTEVLLGGIASKTREAFRSEFEKILTSLKRSK